MLYCQKSSNMAGSDSGGTTRRPGRRSYKCAVCGKAFPDNWKLNRHVTKVHADTHRGEHSEAHLLKVHTITKVHPENVSECNLQIDLNGTEEKNNVNTEMMNSLNDAQLTNDASAINEKSEVSFTSCDETSTVNNVSVKVETLDEKSLGKACVGTIAPYRIGSGVYEIKPVTVDLERISDAPDREQQQSGTTTAFDATKAETFECDICDQGFSRKVYFDQHKLWSHPEVKNLHQCDICGEKFKKKKDMTDHRHKCEMCDKAFQLKQNLEDHNCGASSEKSYECVVCGKSFRFESQLLHHGKAHRGKFRCDFCGETFRKKKDLNFHPCSCSCEICGKILPSLKKLKLHLVIHSEEAPYKCTICGKRFKRPSGLKAHQDVHAETPLYKCNFCGKAFRHASYLKSHARIHTGERPYMCAMCGKGFRTATALKNHGAVHTDVITCTCDVCGAGFKNTKNLNLHLARTHRDKQFKCDTCGRGLASQELLTRHKLSGHCRRSQGGYKCDICGEKFPRRRNLTSHYRKTHKMTFSDMTSHLNTSDTGSGDVNLQGFTCDVCGKVYENEVDLITHARRHTGEKPYSCDICGKTFASKGYVINHVRRTHATLNPHQCDVCGERYATRGPLNRHIKEYSHYKEYTCLFCDKTFKFQHFLEKHLAGWHGKASQGKAGQTGSVTGNVLTEIVEAGSERKGSVLTESELTGSVSSQETSGSANAPIEEVQVNKMLNEGGTAQISTTEKSMNHTRTIAGSVSGQSLLKDVQSGITEKDVPFQPAHNPDVEDSRMKGLYKGSEIIVENIQGSDKMFNPKSTVNHTYNTDEISKNKNHVNIIEEIDSSYITGTGDSQNVGDDLVSQTSSRSTDSDATDDDINSKPFSCAKCAKSFTTTVFLQRHILAEHARTEPAEYKCDECEQVFTSIRGLGNHRRKHQDKSAGEVGMSYLQLGEEDLDQSGGASKNNTEGQVNVKDESEGHNWGSLGDFNTDVKFNSVDPRIMSPDVKQPACDVCGDVMQADGGIFTKCYSCQVNGEVKIEVQKDGLQEIISDLQAGSSVQITNDDLPSPVPPAGEMDDDEPDTVDTSGDETVNYELDSGAPSEVSEVTDCDVMDGMPDPSDVKKENNDAEYGNLVNEQKRLLGQDNKGSCPMQHQISTVKDELTDGIDENPCKQESGQFNIQRCDNSHDGADPDEWTLIVKEEILQNEIRRELQNVSICIKKSQKSKPTSSKIKRSASKYKATPKIPKLREPKNGTSHTCEICGKTFPKGGLSRHRKMHEKPYRCRACGKAFSNESDMTSHEMTSHLRITSPGGGGVVTSQLYQTETPGGEEEKLFQCDKCPKRYKTATSLREHYRNHTGERPYRCEDCGKTFTTRGVYRVHRRRHTGEKPHKCAQCGAAFKTSGERLAHMLIHSGEKYLDRERVQCDVCGKEMWPENLGYHKKHVHEGYRVTCDVCGKTLGSRRNLAKHVKLHNNTRHACSTCHREFTEVKLLRIHQWRHTGVKPFACALCEKSYPVKLGLTRHMRTHHSEAETT